MGHTLICLLLLCIYFENFGSFGDEACKKEPRCTISRTHGMKSIDCYHRDFKSFPKCIPTDAEVLDLSFNRISRINRSDLSQFTSLKLLYLNENFLDNLQNDTFQDLDSLISLDLSEDNMKRIPPSVFQLPSLSKLYLRNNFQLSITASLEGVIPITSPISVIDISSITDETSMSEFPDFGPMPYLMSLNISENRFHTITPRHFAGLCRMKTLINNNVSNNYQDDCDCWIINKWLAERKVVFKNFICSVTSNECQNKQLSEEDMAIYKDCLEIIAAIEKEHRVMKICIGVGVSVLIIIIILFFVYYYLVRKKRSSNNTINGKSGPLDVQTDGPLLVNNQTKTSAGNV